MPMQLLLYFIIIVVAVGHLLHLLYADKRTVNLLDR